MAYTLSVLKGATAILTRVFLSVMLLVIKKIRDARTCLVRTSHYHDQQVIIFYTRYIYSVLLIIEKWQIMPMPIYNQGVRGPQTVDILSITKKYLDRVADGLYQFIPGSIPVEDASKRFS